jgi:N-methylhydantoinase B
MMKTSLDPITFAVVRNALTSAAQEMTVVFKRTVLLPLLYEFNDFGVAVYDDRLNLIAETSGMPLFVGSLDTCIASTLEDIGGRDTLSPGDILLNNHPYLSGAHPPDAAIMEPVFYEGQLIGFSAIRAHVGDVGGKNPYPCDSTELYQEGLVFPALKLYEEGKLNSTIIKILKANSRLPTETAGSMLAGAAAVRACSQKVRSIVDKYGLDIYYSTVDELLNRDERATREAIAEMPDGTYTFEDLMDDNGIDKSPVKIKCAVTIADTDVTIDLTGSAPQQRGAINTPWSLTVTTCRFALKRLTTPDLPATSGSYRPLTVIAPEKSLFNPVPPAPSFTAAWSAMRLSDMIVQALAPALPERIPAENGGDGVFSLAYVKDPETKRISFFVDLGGLGHGALHDRDGMNALIHPSQAGSQSLPAELVETRMPILKRRFELLQDSGGPGKFRGGLSAEAEFEFLGEGSAVVIVEKTKASEVRGLEGGMSPPFKNVIVVFPGTEKELQLGKKADIPIAPGDIMLVRPAGGGGYGDPLDREPDRVLWDLRNEYISPAQAQRVYGVVGDSQGMTVDLQATRQLRSQLRTQRTADEPGRVEKEQV